MADAFQKHFTGIWDSLDEHISVAIIDHPVFHTPDHQNRCLDAGDGIAEVILVTGIPDGIENHFVDVAVGNGLLFHDVVNGPGHEGFLLQRKINQTFKVALLGGDQRIVTAHDQADQLAVVLKNSRRIKEGGGADLVRVGRCIESGDGAAHGVAHHVRSLDAQSIENPRQVPDLILESISQVQLLAAVTMAGQVDGVNVELIRQLPRQSGPVVLVGAKAMDEHDGVAVHRLCIAQVGNGHLTNGDTGFLQPGTGAFPANGVVIQSLAGTGTDHQGDDQY